MRVDLFDFNLPPDRIALRPRVPREAARLLEVGPGDALRDRLVGDLPACLRPGDALVVNDTRVLPARLSGTRRRGETEARIEATLHRRVDATTWAAFVRPAKKLDVGETVVFARGGERLDARVVAKGETGEVTFAFEVTGSALDAAMARVGVMPLPPYVAARRSTDAADATDYQTLFAAHDGAVAAPTAGLHFTPDLVAAARARGVAVLAVTLHVGAGTFLPVKVDDTDDHAMHTETIEVSAATVDALVGIRADGGRVVAVGTTVARALESAAADGTLAAYAGDTRIFITPGYRFRAVDMLMTNFHLPRSTLLMLVSAFCGLDRMRAAYRHAIASGYRFYSYGDAMLLHPEHLP